MMSVHSAPLLSPEEIALRSGQEIPFLRLPERAVVYAEREMRLRQLAASHPMRDFLIFAAELARAQHEGLQDRPAVPIPDAAVLDAAARAGRPPLAATAWPRDPAWRDGLRRLVDRLLPRIAGSPAHTRVRALESADDTWLEQQADRLLNGVMLGLDLGAAPVIAAALQAHWTHLVLATHGACAARRGPSFGRTDDATSCPCCGSRPTASVARIGADASGYRYLHCSLCAAQWHMVRIKCARCEQTKGIRYHSLRAAWDDAPLPESHRPAVEAETCGECGHYLKIVRMERVPQVEPVADDLATITLDLLVSEAGFQRHGVNLLLLFGDPDAGPGPGGS